MEKIPPCPINITIQVERWKKSLLEVVVEEGTPEVAERFTNGQVQRRHIVDTISSIGCGLSSASWVSGSSDRVFFLQNLFLTNFNELFPG